jgi:hypothetical protein
MVTMTSEMSRSMINEWTRCLAPVWLADDVITEDSPCHCVGACLSADSPKSLPHAETRVGLRVEHLLLSTRFKQNLNVSTNFSKISQYEI